MLEADVCPSVNSIYQRHVKTGRDNGFHDRTMLFSTLVSFYRMSKLPAHQQAYKDNPKPNGSWIANMSDPRHYHVKDGIGPVSINPGKSSSIKLRKVTHVVLKRRLSVTF